MLKKAIKKFSFYFGLAVIVFIPFQTLIQNLLEEKLSPSTAFWLAHFYEPLALVLIDLVIVESLISVNFAKFKRTGVPFLLIIFGLISAFFLASSLGRGLEGLRFDFIGILFFLIFVIQTFSPEEKSKFYSFYVVLATLAALLAIVDRFLPLNFWQHLGLNGFGWGNFTVVKVFQSSSFLPGPNQLGSYLLPALFIILMNKAEFPISPSTSSGSLRDNFSFDKLRIPSGQFPKVWKYLLALIVLTAIILSFSRAAFIGLIGGLLAYIVFVEKSVLKKVLYILTAIVIGIILYWAYSSGSQQIKDMFTHGASQSQHQSALDQSINEIKLRVTEPVKMFFGSGIGTAGPAALKYGSGFISESWYLQLLLELGIVGLLLWLYFIFATLYRLYRYNDFGLFLALISVSISAIFLHSWADNPAMAITLLILIGAAVNTNQNNVELKVKS